MDAKYNNLICFVIMPFMKENSTRLRRISPTLCHAKLSELTEWPTLIKPHRNACSFPLCLQANRESDAEVDCMRLPHPKHVLSDASPRFPKPGSVINYLGECEPQDVGHAKEDLDVVQIKYVAMNVRRGLSTKAVKIQSTNDSMKNEVPTASAIHDLPQEEHINVLQQRFSLLLVNPRLLGGTASNAIDNE